MPATHSVNAVQVVWPLAFTNVPAGHGEQLAAFVTDDTVPAGQAVQALQVVAVDGVETNEPGEQSGTALAATVIGTVRLRM